MGKRTAEVTLRFEAHCAAGSFGGSVDDAGDMDAGVVIERHTTARQAYLGPGGCAVDGGAAECGFCHSSGATEEDLGWRWLELEGRLRGTVSRMRANGGVGLPEGSSSPWQRQPREWPHLDEPRREACASVEEVNQVSREICLARNALIL